VPTLVTLNPIGAPIAHAYPAMFADAVRMKIKITRSNAPSTSYSWTGDRDINQNTYRDQKGRRSDQH
jgi:hypothetical protein